MIDFFIMKFVIITHTGLKILLQIREDGFLIPLNNRNVFTEKLSSLIKNPVLRKKMISNQKFKLDIFSRKNVMGKWNGLVLNLVKK